MSTAPPPMSQALESNPYQPPVAEVQDLALAADQQQLAGRGMRLVGALVDSVLYGIAGFVAAAVGGVVFSVDPTLAAMGALGAYGVGVLALLGVNLYLLHKNGQTIGKAAVNIKIVRQDGSAASLGRLFLLRMLLPYILYFIPFLGLLFMLVDALFIFRLDRRCVHDLMADTKVVNAA